MPTTIRIAGRYVQIDDGDIDQIMGRLVFVTRQYMWMPARLAFDSKYEQFQYHSRYHALNLGLLVMEALGGADLPRAGGARRLKRERDQLNRLLNPRGIGQFYQQFGNWNTRSRIFNREMRRYLDNVQIGGGRTVRALELTRDASFTLLAALAMLPTGGGSLAAAPTVTATLVRGAAVNFVVAELQNSATRLGRALAGQTVTTRQTMDDISRSLVSAVPNAMMGQIFGAFMSPMTRNVTEAAQAEIAAGRLGTGQAMSFSVSQIEAAVQAVIQDFVTRNAADARTLLASCPATSSNTQCARLVGDGLLQHSGFRRQLNTRLERAAR